MTPHAKPRSKTSIAWTALGIGTLTACLTAPHGSARADERGWQPRFAALDVDGDGRLTGAEREPVKGFDLDGDAIVSEDEFLTGVRRLAEGVGGKWFTEFAKLDADGDGRLSGTEAAGLDPLIFDFDRERRLSAEEFVAGKRRESAARMDLGAGRVVLVTDNSRRIVVQSSDTLRFPVTPSPGAIVVPRVRGPAVVTRIADEAPLRRGEMLVPIVGGGPADGETRIVEGRTVKVVPIRVPADVPEPQRRIDVAVTGPGEITVEIVVVPASGAGGVTHYEIRAEGPGPVPR